MCDRPLQPHSSSEGGEGEEGREGGEGERSRELVCRVLAKELKILLG